MSRSDRQPAARPSWARRRAPEGPIGVDLDRFALRAARTLSRRSVLRGLVGGAPVLIGLPLLECMLSRRALAGEEAAPRRFGMYFWGNGNVPSFWAPEDTGAGWTPTNQLSSLADHTDVVSVISGLAVKLPNTEVHWAGAAGLLSAAPLLNTGEHLNTLDRPSIDQVIATAIGGQTAYRSLQTSATECAGVSFNGPYSMNQPESDPYTFYRRIFGGDFVLPGTPIDADPRNLLRRSALDGVMDQISALQRQVSLDDRIRLEQHLDGVRELEHRIALLDIERDPAPACELPDTPPADYPDDGARPQISARSRAMVDMLAMVATCDQTRVFLHHLTEPISEVLFPDASAGHHELTHNEPGDQPEVEAITVQIVAEYAYMVEKFRSIRELDGTLLDSFALMGCSEVSLGRIHAIDELPILLAGTCGGALTQGIHYRSESAETVTSLLITLMRAMEIEVEDYGWDEAWTNKSLVGIEA